MDRHRGRPRQGALLARNGGLRLRPAGLVAGRQPGNLGFHPRELGSISQRTIVERAGGIVGSPLSKGDSMRILIAALLGAIAMFAWTSVAHMATPLAYIGFSPIPNEAPVLSAMETNIGAKPGLYFYPWLDPKDPHAM